MHGERAHSRAPAARNSYSPIPHPLPLPLPFCPGSVRGDSSGGRGQRTMARRCAVLLLFSSADVARKASASESTCSTQTVDTQTRRGDER